MIMLKQKSTSLQVKQLTEDGTIEGYLNTFNHIDRIGDNTQKGAFTKSINKIKANGDVLPMLFGHDHTKVAGVWTEIKEDENGLYGKGKLNLDTQLGKELYSNIKMGAVKGISIGYFEVDTDYDAKSGAKLLKELDLIEASIVLLPCNEQSQVEAVKTALEQGEQPSKVQVEKALREMGFSRKNSKTILAEGYKNFYEDGQVDSVADIHRFVWNVVEELSPEDLRDLIDKLNEFINKSEEAQEEISEEIEDNEGAEEIEDDLEEKQEIEKLNTKLDALLNALNKS